MPTSEAALLEVLRRRTGVPGLRYAAPPLPVKGGLWADILAVRFEGAPPELEGDLIIRIMPDTAVADREILVQSEVASQGFPAPQVRLTGDANAGLGRPFMVMDRVPGRTPVGEPSGTAALAQLGLAALRLPDLLARTVARLHALDPEPLRRSLAQLDTAVVDIPTLLEHLDRRATGSDRPDLAAAARAMSVTRPAGGREVICHGDFHPLNILVDGDDVSVIDWSLGMVADPAFDLAFTAMTMSMAPIALPPRLRRPIKAAARQGSRHFLRRYRHYRPSAGASLGDDVLAWYTAVHCLRALAELAEWIEAGTADERAGHPWFLMAPEMAVHVEGVVGRHVRPM